VASQHPEHTLPFFRRPGDPLGYGFEGTGLQDIGKGGKKVQEGALIYGWTGKGVGGDSARTTLYRYRADLG
jgi:hypothetical protein